MLGPYENSGEEANGAPLYVKQVVGGGKHYLYRHTDSGQWRVTDDESDITTGVAGLSSCGASDLPSSAGLTWQCVENGAFHEASDMRCTAVRLREAVFH